MAKTAIVGAAVDASVSTASPPIAGVDTAPPLPTYVCHDNKVFKLLRVGGFKGYVPNVEVPTLKPFMTWEGGKITQALWDQILAFFEWTQTEFKSESQVRLYHHPVRKEWAAWAYPQTPDGMTTREMPDHADTAAQRAQFPSPWQLLGTVHHHCTSGAFQSGTDATNEQSQEGVHITVGKVGSKEYDLHGRVIVRNQQYDCNWFDWFEMPVSYLTLPSKLHVTILDFMLKDPPAPGTTFPDAWKTNCHKPVRSTSFQTGHGGYMGSSAGTSYGGTSGTGGAGRTYIIQTDLKAQFTQAELDFMEECVGAMSRCKLSHNVADAIIAAEDPKTLPEADAAFRSGVFEAAHRHNLGALRVDELFDKWDFETVLGELKRLATPDTSAQHAETDGWGHRHTMD